MAKMRGIKPETFTDDKILQVSPAARWLFVGMWTQACDNGHLDNNHIQLKVRLLPMDNVEVSDLVQELSTGGLLEDRGEYLAIPNLPKHQKIDRRFIVFCKWCDHDENAVFSPSDKLKRNTSKRRAPDEQQERSDDSTSSTRRAPDVRPTSTQRAPVDEGEGEGEGEGEYISNPTEQPTLSLVHPEASADASDRFEEFWKAYPKRSKANPKKPAREKFERITKKVDPQILIDAAHAYAKSEEGNDPKFIAQTQTWLNQERWQDTYDIEETKEKSIWNMYKSWNTQN